VHFSRLLGLLGELRPGYGTYVPHVSQVLTVASLATGLNAEKSLAFVKRAQSLLAGYTWSEVVRIDNASDASRYPEVVSALVFQLDRALWFYTPTDGTQSLSQYRGRVAADKLELGPLLAAIDPGFTRWEVLDDVGEQPVVDSRIPNGCFIESMALLFQRLARGGQVQNPKLLSYYVALPGGIRGHTVLQFTSGGELQVVDPDHPARTIRIRHARGDDPKSVVGRIRGDVAKARNLPLGEFLGRAPEGYSSLVSVQSNKG
jgi:hypothetical protein